ncbi:DUF1672 family protein [Listeria booriae]|uniref:DUF1672 family protein n=1 Tax=Listeria booriae TaxID=1552123 RepID=UPI00288024C0|nr:DUF1672 family protein [Listeria booriae]MDT0112449.1 DUF1672 family protein [Listeria booriae]
MNLKIPILLAIALIMGGCGIMNGSQDKDTKSLTSSVQDYNGQGFVYRDGSKTTEIVAANKKEISESAKNYMKLNYNQDVNINNVVPALGAAVVHVSSKDKLEYFTSVIVSLDTNETPPKLSTTSQQYEVEKAIVSGLYHYAYAEEFKKVDSFAKEVTEKWDVVGLNEKAIEKTSSGGYVNPFYYISVSPNDFEDIYKKYMENPSMSLVDVRGLFEEKHINPEDLKLNISFRFFMSKKGAKADKKVATEIIQKLKSVTSFPVGSYAVFVYGNTIVNRDGMGEGSSVGTVPAVDDINIK